MISTDDVRTYRLASWWTRRYTAGLPRRTAEDRRLEINSDLAEHRIAREIDGWSSEQVGREQLERLIRGMPADLGWRHDILSRYSRTTNGLLRWSVLTATTVASMLLAVFYGAFAAVILGDTALTDQRFLGGMAGYAADADQPIEILIFSTVLAGFALILLIASVGRLISPFMANLATAGPAGLLVLFFWLGVAPIALIAVFGSLADMFLRSPDFSSRS